MLDLPFAMVSPTEITRKRKRRRRRARAWRRGMLDLLYILTGIAGFVVLWAIAKACDRL